MELPHIGEVCVICRRNDYLPFKCSHCEKIVCIEHRTNHGEECPIYNLESATNFSETDSILVPCDYCKKPSLKLELVVCIACSKSHCLTHRHQVEHDCLKLEQQKLEHFREKARKSLMLNETLEKLRSSCKTTSAPLFAQPIAASDTKKHALARRLRIMRIKQSARGPPNILDSDKIYFEVTFVHHPGSRLSSNLSNNRKAKFYASPKHTVGRLVDWVSDDMAIVNKNNLDGQDILYFYKKGDSRELQELDSQKTFGEYIDAGEIDNGDELCMSYKVL